MIGSSKSISGFDPRSIPGCQVWFDGADTNTITGTTTVTQWKDKSANGWTATTLIGTAPSTTSVNGLNAVSFPASSTLTVSNVTLGGQARAVFCVYKTSGTGNYISAFDVQSASATSYGAVNYWYANGSNMTMYAHTASGDTSTLQASSSGTVTTNSIALMEFVQSATSTSNNFIGINGVSQTITTNTLATTYPSGTSNYYIGNSYGIPVVLCEYIQYVGEILTSQRQQVEGYLAWKWFAKIQPPVFYSPTMGSPQYWFDSSDIMNMSGAGSGLTISNKGSFTGSNITVYSGSPSTATQNGLNTTVLGSGATLFFTGIFSNQPRTRFIASKPTTAGVQTVFLYQNLSTTSGNDFLGSSYGAGLLEVAQGNIVTIESSSIPEQNGIFGIYTFLNAISASSNNRTALTGSNITLSSSSTAQQYNSGSTISYINSSNSQNLGEWISYNSELTTTQAQLVEGYLAWKWGVQSNLPSGHPWYSDAPPTYSGFTNILPQSHPFYSVRPFSRVFVPLDVPGCQLWLDAADSSQLTFSSGTSNVTVWGDKANGSNATANTPIAYASNGLGTGYPALTFTGSQWLLGNTSVTGTGLTIFSVFNMSNSSAGVVGRIVALAATGANDYNTTSYVFVGRQGVAAVGPYRNGTAPAATVSYSTPTLNTTYFDGTNAYTSTNGGTPVTAASSGSFAVTAYAIGNNTNTGDVPNGPFNGYISEVLVYNVTLTDIQRQQVEGYLAWKWGLVGSIPSTHPYYSLPSSSVLPFLPTNIQRCSLWLDASKELGSNGSSITSLTDWSGSGNDAAPVSGNTITLATSYQNGMTVYNFGNYRASVSNFRWTIDFTMFVVAKTVSGGFLLSQQASGGTYYNYVNTGNWDLMFLNNAFGVRDSVIAQGTPVVSTNQFFLFCIGYKSNTSNAANYSVNGTVRSSTAGTAQQYMTVTQPQTLFLNGNYSGAFDSSQVAELIFYAGALTDSQRQQVEGYLAQKWNF